MMKTMLLMRALVALASLVALGEVQAASAVDAQGNIHVPNDYRTRFEPLGSWAVAADAGQGTVSHAQTLKGWFVMVKDAASSHTENKLWGDGWGWSWFDAGNPSKTTSTPFPRQRHVMGAGTGLQ